MQLSSLQLGLGAPLHAKQTGACASVAVPACGALEKTRVRWSLSCEPNRAPRLCTRAAAPSIPMMAGRSTTWIL